MAAVFYYVALAWSFGPSSNAQVVSGGLQDDRPALRVGKSWAMAQGQIAEPPRVRDRGSRRVTASSRCCLATTPMTASSSTPAVWGQGWPTRFSPTCGDGSSL
jgi:hypothetical protein